MTGDSSAPPGAIGVRGAAEHNLRDLDVDVPHGVFAVVTGVSGSGKSSLAFDTICRESQRRYFETFSTYARQFLGRYARPAVGAITGLPPAVAVDQRTVVRNPRSTVGTLSEIYDWLRLLFARLGRWPDEALDDRPPLSRDLFSFNTPLGACPACRGLGVEDRLDPDLLVRDPGRTLRQGALTITLPSGYTIYSQVTIDVLDQVCRAHGFSVDVPWRDLSDEQRRVVLEGSDRLRIPYGKHPLSSRLRWKGITARPREEGTYKGILPVMEQVLRQKRNRNILRFVRTLPCRECGGTRLGPAARAVTVLGQSLGDLVGLEIGQLADWFERVRFAEGDRAPGEAIRREVLKRAVSLIDLGLGYLTLGRDAASLSAGEAQRIRLASQAGVGLRHLLYVLDEPSAGVHDRDVRALVRLLARLRDRGNTLLVVEHDETTIRAADWVVDVGPGAGTAGGRLLFSGPRQQFLEADGARTDTSVAGGAEAAASGLHEPVTATPIRTAGPAAASPTRDRLLRPVRLQPVTRAGAGDLRILPLRAVCRNNLQSIDVDLRLRALNVVTGVSGAGKSSLVEELAARARDGRLGPAAPPGGVVLVDQAPIGRTPRSNPATYTGAFDLLRDRFAALPDAVARGLGKGHFSFNVPGGRCEACEGAGVIDVGMHFLGTVQVTCEACGGRRFHADTLGVRLDGLTIHDVLELTVSEARLRFAGRDRLHRILSALDDLGLGYLKLGQPSTTLSGGEAQRVKLATELAVLKREAAIYAFDEPTAGLHPADVSVLVEAFARLVGLGHTVVVVEHDLDVVAGADWVVDLGPESGTRGGRIVVAGTPAEVAACRHSHTGAALRARLAPPSEHVPVAEEAPAFASGPSELGTVAPLVPPSAAGDGRRAGRHAPIRLRGVSTNNLRAIAVDIPINRLVVVTGVSGSGKSSLAFDTIFAEGRNRFLESFPAFVRRLGLAGGESSVEAVSGLTPAVAIGQSVLTHNPRSTVGTLTGIDDVYRVLFSRVGQRPCPACGARLGAAQVAAGRPCPACGAPAPPPLDAASFSPNSERGACRVCKGLGVTMACDPDRLVTDPARPLAGGAMDGHRPGRFYGDPHGQHMAVLAAVGRALGIDFDQPFDRLDERGRQVALHGTGSDRVYDVEWRYRRGVRSGVHRFQSPWLGLCHHVREEYERKHGGRRAEALEPLVRELACAACGGDRLQPAAREVTVAGLGLAALNRMGVEASLGWFEAWAAHGGWASSLADAGSRAAAGAMGAEAAARLGHLREAGLGYLSMDRRVSTLSAGEAQRLRIAVELASGLTGLTCVLDEPTVGLHPRDTSRLVGLLRRWRDAGNTVVVVEHDLEVVRAADHVIDLGPGAGLDGGRVVAQGAVADVAASPDSRTGRWLRGDAEAGGARSRRGLRAGVAIRGAARHNLDGLDVDVPAGGLVAVTGVSGSGKSTLAFDVIVPSVARVLARRDRAPAGGGVRSRSEPGPVRIDPGVHCASCRLEVPLARVVGGEGVSGPGSMTSTPATVTGAFDRLRARFAATPEARAAGLSSRDFSTSVRGGRCERCEGVGQVRVSLDFLPDVWVECDRCHGRRFTERVLACRWRGRSMDEVLALRVSDARRLFADDRPVAAPFDLLDEIGLGYLTIGQATSTLSGGERQRLALARELLDRGSGAALFVFDEPTTGLHPDDVQGLLGLFGRLIEAGHSVVVVEHNLQVIEAADWVIDLGPEGGPAGGRLVAAGTPEVVAACEASHTGRALRAARARRLAATSPLSDARSQQP